VRTSDCDRAGLAGRRPVGGMLVVRGAAGELSGCLRRPLNPSAERRSRSKDDGGAIDGAPEPRRVNEEEDRLYRQRCTVCCLHGDRPLVRGETCRRDKKNRSSRGARRHASRWSFWRAASCSGSEWPAGRVLHYSPAVPGRFSPHSDPIKCGCGLPHANLMTMMEAIMCGH
jgi:hypothetical protein